MEEPILEIKQMNFSFEKDQTVLKNVNLKINGGDYVMFFGPNGGGKSTLLKLIIGLLKPDQGEIRVFGKPPGKSAFKVGYLPQQVNVNPNFPISVLEVVLMGSLGIKRSLYDKKKLRNDAIVSLEEVGMASFLSRRIGKLSGGQQQKVLLARALIDKPDLLILDEPTASVDSAAKGGLYELFNKLNKNITIIMASHDISVIPLSVKSIACVNRKLYFHSNPEITQEMMHMMYGVDTNGNCPVELVAHGEAHRLLSPHK